MKVPASYRYWMIVMLLVIGLPASHTVCAADMIISAEAALARFRSACDNEVKLAVPPGTMTRINALRNAPSLVVARKSFHDFSDFKNPQKLADVSRYEIFGSHVAVSNSTGDIWVLTYDAMKGLVVFLDAASGVVLCVAFVPEG